MEVLRHTAHGMQHISIPHGFMEAKPHEVSTGDLWHWMGKHGWGLVKEGNSCHGYPLVIKRNPHAHFAPIDPNDVEPVALKPGSEMMTGLQVEVRGLREEVANMREDNKLLTDSNLRLERAVRILTSTVERMAGPTLKKVIEEKKRELLDCTNEGPTEQDESVSKY